MEAAGGCGPGRANDDFREHCGFLALMLVCVACTVWLMGVLRSILRPLLWALFLVMGLTPAVALVERVLLCSVALWCRGFANVTSCLCGLGRWVCSCRCLKPCWRRWPPCSIRQAAARRVAGPAPVAIGAPGDERRAAAVPAGGDSAAGGDREPPECSAGDTRTWGPCARFVVHVVAIAVVVSVVICLIGGFVLMVIQSVFSLQDHWRVYKQGAHNIAESVQRIIAHATGSIPREVVDEIASGALTRAEGLLSALITEVLGNAWRFVLEFLMMVLYIAFWLFDPMPVGSKMEELFKRYIILKGLACLGYGICVGLLLYGLGVDLAAAFGLAAFLLSFVPEVGAIAAMLLPAPVILFDSRLESPGMTLATASLAQLGLKFVFANVVEVKLVEADQLMRMHPVIILLAVAFFGYLWGPTGMLLSVPLVAYLKMTLLSDKVPPRYRDPVLVFLEGDRAAPAKYALQQRSSRPVQAAGPSGGVGQGATADLEVPAEMKERLAPLATKAAAAIGIRFCSVDVVEVEQEGLMIMEVNSGVMMDSLMGQLGEAGTSLASRLYETALLRALGQ